MRLMGVDPRTDLFALQAMRSSRPGHLAESEERRAVFGSAIEQFEALHQASASVPPSASPITLFYAISQAGRAMSAALIPDPDGWRSFGHGLSVGGDQVDDLGALQTSPGRKPDSSFVLFCRSIGSGLLTGPVTLNELWGASARFRMVDGLGGEAPVAERITDVQNDDGRLYLEGKIAEGLPQDPEQRTTEIEARLAAYVDNVDGVESKVTLWPNHTFDPARVEFTWKNSDGTDREFEEIATPLLPSGETGCVLVPMIGENRDKIHPLAATYACLLALSSVARYQPELWQKSLDRDRSPVAVAVEEALDYLLESLPFQVKGFLASA